MTKREAAIISTYTGYLIGDFIDTLRYMEELMGRSLWTHEIPSIQEELHEKSKPDFLKIVIANE